MAKKVRKTDKARVLTPEEMDPEVMKPEIVKEYEKLQTTAAELQDKNLRLLAEMDNVRKNAQKQRQDYMRYKNEDIARDLLGIMDDFERSLKALDEESAEGVKLIFNKFKSTLSKYGVKPMTIEEGADFNTDFHEAVSVIAAGEEMKNKVIAVTDTGYMYYDKVLRYAKVVVGQ